MGSLWHSEGYWWRLVCLNSGLGTFGEGLNGCQCCIYVPMLSMSANYLYRLRVSTFEDGRSRRAECSSSSHWAD